MSNTAANPSAFDPLENMPPDEPRFVLRGRDPAAPDAITEWARVRRNRAMRKFNALEHPADTDRIALKSELEQCSEAEDLAMQMREWQQDHRAPEGDGRASYNDIVRSQEQLAEVERGKRRAEALKHLQEGRYHFCEARDALGALELIGPQTTAEMTVWLDRAQELHERHSVTNSKAAPQPALPLQEAE